jgi:hypothetical protein
MVKAKRINVPTCCAVLYVCDLIVFFLQLFINGNLSISFLGSQENQGQLDNNKINKCKM